MQLSRRLEEIVALIPPGGIVADIGGDRGELSYALLQRGIAKKIILTDLSPLSLNRARQFFKTSPYKDRIVFRCGAGFSVLEPGEAQTAVLAGMGGGTIIKIFSASPELFQSFDTLLIQAMRDTDQIRQYLTEHGMRISAETLIREDGIFYTVIKAEKGTMTLTWEEALLGPLLLARREPILAEFLQEQIERRESILRQLTQNNQGQDRRALLKQELQFLKELE